MYTNTTLGYLGMQDGSRFSNWTNFWAEIDGSRDKRHYLAWRRWWRSLDEDHKSLTLARGFNWSQHFLHGLVSSLRHPAAARPYSYPKPRNDSTSFATIRMIHLYDFFIDYVWMDGHMPDIRRWTAVSREACCHHARPPADVVVVHVRDFGQEGSAAARGINSHIKAGAFVDILARCYTWQFHSRVARLQPGPRACRTDHGAGVAAPQCGHHHRAHSV
uniref:Uncharacterized protein n=1 Tax=Haptolina ericina TaxID=156174 RepID=A0A6T9D4T9_9EUKA|mmetsp:Transcript_25945/g.58941  ORF Transcript_25945/g.58941 Transcript_25945/m.58941 type:complete len:218 (+) Transcript_25945:182-835(+)